VHVYDTEAGAWRRSSTAPFAPRFCHASAFVGGKVWVIGATAACCDVRHMCSCVFSLQPDCGMQRCFGTQRLSAHCMLLMTVATSDCQWLICRGTIALVGGADKQHVHGDVWAFDLRTSTWEEQTIA